MSLKDAFRDFKENPELTTALMVLYSLVITALSGKGLESFNDISPTYILFYVITVLIVPMLSILRRMDRAQQHEFMMAKINNNKVKKAVQEIEDRLNLLELAKDPE